MAVLTGAAWSTKAHRDPSLRNHFVYRVFDAAGVLLYVGCTIQPEARWSGHKASNPALVARAASFRMQGPYNYATAREIERQAIYTESPVFNYTPDVRAADRAHSKLIDARMADLIASGMPWPEAVKQAVAENEPSPHQVWRRAS